MFQAKGTAKTEEEIFRNYCSGECCGEAVKVVLAGDGAMRHIRKYCKLLQDRVDLTW